MSIIAAPTSQGELLPTPEDEPVASGRINYVKLLKLFTNKHTCELYERQTSSLRRMVHLAALSSTGGFAMSSLPLVQRILTLACDNIRLGHDEFIDPACGVLETLGKPFERVRANEEFHSLDVVCDTLVVMSSIMDSPQCGHKIVLTATRALKAQLEMTSLADADGTSASVGMATGVNRDDLRPNMWQFKQSAVQRSGMIKIVMNAFRRSVNDARTSGMQSSRPNTTQPAQNNNAQNYGGSKKNIFSYDDTEGKEEMKSKLDQVSSMMVGIPIGTTDGGAAQRFELVRAVISVLRELAYTKSNAEALIREGAPLVLFRALELVSTDLKDETVELAIDVLWNLLEVSSDELRKTPTAAASGGSAASAAAAGIVRTRFHLLDKHRATNCLRMLGTARVVATLRSLLERSLVEGFRARDKELRNNILVTASLLTRRRENQPHFVNTGFLSLLLLYSCAQEVGLPTDANEHNYATQSEQDFELKRLMWQEIGDLCAGASASEEEGNHTDANLVYNMVRQAPLVEALLLYLDATGNAPDGLHWTKPQMRTLTIDACALLLETLAVPACVQRFLDEDGPLRVLRFLENLALVDSKRIGSMKADPSTDSMNSDQSNQATNGGNTQNIKRSGGMVAPVPRTGVDPEMTIAAMRLLARSCRLTEVGGRLGEAGAMRTLVALFGLSFGEQGDKTVEMRTICGSIVADLCDPESSINLRTGDDVKAIEKRASVVNQKYFRRAGGVELVRNHLDVDGDELAIKGPKLTMSLVDMTWRSVVGNKRSEAIFVAEDGVDTLLNLMENVPSSMHRQLLGCIADLMLNPTSRPYFRAWRSDTNLYGAAVMCLRMWAAEEHRLGIHRGPAGVLTNLDRPLDGKDDTFNSNASMVESSVFQGSAVIDGMDENEQMNNDNKNQEEEEESDYDDMMEASAMSNNSQPGSPSKSPSRNGTSGIMSKAEQDPHALPIIFPPTAKRGGSKFERLREALAAAKDLVIFGEDSQPGAEMKKVVANSDLRIKVWSVLTSVGWDRLDTEDDDQATEAALIVLSMAEHYEDFITTRAWQDVKDKIISKGMNPIRADSLLIETELEKGFNLANETRYQQLKYVDVLHKKADHAEKEFYDGIRQQQEQEIQAHLVTRKMVDPRAGAKRKMKANMK